MVSWWVFVHFGRCSRGSSIFWKVSFVKLSSTFLWLSQSLKTSLFIYLLYFEGSPQEENPLGVMWWGRSSYISTFPSSHGKIFWWDGSRKFKNIRREATDQENSKKQEGKNGGKKKKKILHTLRFPVYSPSVGNALRLLPLCDLPQENPLIWEPPLQHL